MEAWCSVEGNPTPLGVSYIPEERSFNFAIYSKFATRLQLLVFNHEPNAGPGSYINPDKVYDLDYHIHKSERVWHIRIPKTELGDAAYYAYKIWGPEAENGHYRFHTFDPEKIMLDPFAKAVFFPPDYSRAASCQYGPNMGKAPLGVISVNEEPFDWEGCERPIYEDQEPPLIIYETHVKQFTFNVNSGVPEYERGTYRGIIHKIKYLKELGITAIELMPIHQWDPQEGSSWGYMTLNFFSPHHAYSSNTELDGAISEFKEMVKELHKAGIKVILDVVYNHTTEGDYLGPLYSYKGIDNSTYYLTTDGSDGQYVYLNLSGTGNTLSCANQLVRQMILESLRYWYNEVHVDGFRFDLASILARKTDGSLDLSNPPILFEIFSDPKLRDAILIAEPWEPDLSLLGKRFPGYQWRQWNARFRDDVKSFIRGDVSMVGALALRMYGSDDLFPANLFHANHSFQSINYLASHDGYTLYDCAAYSTNQAENDRNKSWNCGWEGEVNIPVDIMILRKRQVKNMITLLMLSNGTPMFRAGDEFLQTQTKTTGPGTWDNPYNVDDPSVWMNWTRLERFKDIFGFFSKMIAFRKRHPSISRSRFWGSDVQWYGPQGNPDFSSSSHTLAIYLHGQNPQFGIEDKDLYVMINAYWEAITFSFQQPGPWNRVVNTGLDAGSDFIAEYQELVTETSYLVGPRSVIVFVM